MSRLQHLQRAHRGAPQAFQHVVAALAGLSPQQADLLITMGGAYLGKHRCKDHQATVKAGQLVQLYFRLPLVYEPVPFQESWLRSRHKGYLLAVKPAGLPTQGRRDADYHAFYELLKQHVGGYVGLHHRLDQDTSGLMLFTTQQAWNKDAGRLFSEHRLEKTYLAVAQGTWPDPTQNEWVVEAPILAKREPQGTRQVVDPAGKSARTEFTCLAQADGLLLLAAKPVTGRTHQIRVHAAHLGLPLWGDTFYGGDRCAHSFLLHCARLRWPKTGKMAAGDVSAPPAEPVWHNLPTPLREQALAWAPATTPLAKDPPC